jgi:PST family polysaccharide transporter
VFALAAATRALPRIRTGWSPATLLAPARRLGGVGLPFVLNAMLASGGALLLRVLIQADLGLSAVGQFQAAYAVTTVYLTFIFTALVTDYFPLLSGLADDEPRLNRAANSQLLVAVLISAPLVMLMIVAAPVIVPILYSNSFGNTPHLLQLMLLGELAKIAGWTLGYILIARTARTMFVVTEFLYSGLLIGITAALIPALGLEGTAVAYVGCQVAALGWTLVFVRRASNFRLARTNIVNLTAYGAAAAVVYASAREGGLALALAWIVAVATVIVAGRTLLRHVPEGPDQLRRLLRMKPRSTS